MYRDKHFTAYARKVAKADAGRTTGDAARYGLPETIDFEGLGRAARPQQEAPQQEAKPSGKGRTWIAPDSPYLDPEQRNRDYGGYRPALGEYADPAQRGGEWQGKTPPPGEAPPH